MAIEGVLAPAFAARPGATKHSQDNLASQLPPLLADCDTLRIDIIPLLLYGHMVMDRVAFDYVTRSKHSKTQFLARQLTEFHESNIVILKDFSSVGIDQLSILRSEREKAIAENREFWVKELRNTILWWEANYPKYQKAYPKHLGIKASTPWSISAALEGTGDKFTAVNVAQTRRAIFEDLSEAQHSVTDLAIAGLFDYTGSNRLNALRFDAPVIDWPDMEGFMTAGDRIAASRKQTQTSMARFVLHEMAKISLAEMSNADVILMLGDRRVRNFRRYINTCTDNGWSYLNSEKEALYKALIDYKVKFDNGKLIRYALRLTFPLLAAEASLVADHFGAPHETVQTVARFLKGIKGQQGQGNLGDAYKAIYAIRRHYRTPLRSVERVPTKRAITCLR